MRQHLKYISLALLAAACAHQDTKTGAPVADAKLGAEYATSPQSLRALETRGECPRQVAAFKGKNWKVQIGAANACVQRGQWQMVESLGQDMAQSQHLVPWGAYYLSLAAEHRGEIPRALWMIELALKKAPGNGLLTYQQGRLFWRGKDQAAALKSFKRATELDTRLVDAHLILGQTALAGGQADEAGRRFQAALDTEPRHTAALFGLAETRIKKNDGKGANDALAQVIFLQPSSYRARVRQAFVLETMEKNFPEALAAYRRIKALARDRKLDSAVDMDLDAKIAQLESVTKAPQANQLSLREAGPEKKGDK